MNSLPCSQKKICFIRSQTVKLDCHETQGVKKRIIAVSLKRNTRREVLMQLGEKKEWDMSDIYIAQITKVSQLIKTKRDETIYVKKKKSNYLQWNDPNNEITLESIRGKRR